MNRSVWVFIFTVLGLIALSALVWFLGPMIGLEDLLTLGLIIGGIWLFAFIVWMIRRWRRKRQAAALEENVVKAAEDDTPVLREKMEDAISTLRKSSKRGGSAFLYDLPWYIIIGPPGSGKTTALINSGLKFPLAGAGGAQAIAGVGGTRHCDWWFTEDAVMIDTAGRYTTQDSDADVDQRSWTGFLDMLSQTRPRQPINGVMVCISVEDIMTLPPHELALHANAIRSRLDELHTRLQISFPVYVMLTKMDLVAGFTDYFGDLTDQQRAIVWGTTFQPKDRTDNMISEFPEQFDTLMLALSEQLSDRLAQEPDPQSRARAFGFPTQMASLKDPINGFLTQVFEPSRYQSDAALRGVYFTSGTQEGTPIDRVLGALSRSFGAQGAAAPVFSGRGKSFFLTDLLQKVVFTEAGWVSTNLKHLRRTFALKTIAYVALFAGTVGMGGLWGYSYLQNADLQDQVDRSLDNYREKAVNLINETEITDPDLQPVLDPLDSLRLMPLGYASADEVPLTQGLGLSQHERLRDANIASYRDALDRLFIPRLIFRVEEQLKANLGNPDVIYEGLKVYLMLGGQAKMEEDLVATWMMRDWERQYPGAANRKGREKLAQHLSAAMERPNSTVPLNGPLVQQAQRTLARLPVANRAYTLLKTRAETVGYEPWIAAERGGPDSDIVFETRDGAPLTDVEIPGFFTYRGFHQGFLEQIEVMVDLAANERWVMGNVGEQSAIQQQFGTIRQDMMGLYRADFIANWDQQLSRLKIAPVGGGGDLTVISALAAPTSPLKQMLQSVTGETQLTKVPEEDEEGGGDGGAGGAAANKEAAKLLKKTLGKGGALGRVAAKSAIGAMNQPGGGGAVAINYGERIEAHFKPLHDFAGEPGGPGAVDGLIARFNNLYQAMNQMRGGGVAAQQATEVMASELQAMEAETPRMPGLVANIAEETMGELGGVALGSAKSILNDKFENEVARTCQEIVENTYPFFSASAREVGLDDFTRLFGTGGIMHRFFEQNLAPLVDRSSSAWKGRGDTALSRQLSNQALRQFQRADTIRNAFFPAGAPMVTFTMIPETLSAQATSVTFDYDGQKLSYAHGIPKPIRMQWPGGGAGQIEIAVTPEIAGASNRISRTGMWSLFRVIRASGYRIGSDMGLQFDLGGRQATFTLKSDSALNPFGLTELAEFRCPRGL
ncbi:MAG: type VI secretion system membrane subunit TssM [Pseudomonadota bacterium]